MAGAVQWLPGSLGSPSEPAGGALGGAVGGVSPRSLCQGPDVYLEH